MKRIALLAYPLVAVAVVSLAAADIAFAVHPVPEGCISAYASAATGVLTPTATTTTQQAPATPGQRPA